MRRKSGRGGTNVLTTLIDLMLNGYRMSSSETPLGRLLRDPPRDRAVYDAIRSLHLRCEKRSLLTSIFSTLTPNDENARCTRIKSIISRHVNVPEFFALYRLPELWCPSLPTRVTIPSWEDFGSRTTALATPNYPTSCGRGRPTCPNRTSITLDPRSEPPPSEPHSLQGHDSLRQRGRIRGSSTSVSLEEALSD